MRENNERSNELNEQELELVAGGTTFTISRGPDVQYRCPNCQATKTVKVRGGVPSAPMCDNCIPPVQMVKA